MLAKELRIQAKRKREAALRDLIRVNFRCNSFAHKVKETLRIANEISVDA